MYLRACSGNLLSENAKSEVYSLVCHLPTVSSGISDGSVLSSLHLMHPRHQEHIQVLAFLSSGIELDDVGLVHKIECILRNYPSTLTHFYVSMFLAYWGWGEWEIRTMIRTETYLVAAQ